MAATVTLEKIERDVLWDRATFDGPPHLEAVQGEFEKMHPSPINKEPQPADSTKARLAFRVGLDLCDFFDQIGWEWKPDKEEFKVAASAGNLRVLRHLDSCIVEELDEADSALTRLSERVVEGDWLPKGNKGRSLGDELLEQRYYVRVLVAALEREGAA